MSSVLELRAAGRPLPLQALLHLEALLAADLPDRLSAAFVGESEGAPRPGDRIELRVDGAVRFRGLAASSGRCEKRGAASWSFTARADWADRAAALLPEEEQVEMTDAEAAARLADQLGLAGAIEATPVVRRRVTRRGVAEFLQSRARGSGYAWAIARGRLHFGPRLPERVPAHLARPGHPVLSLAVFHARSGRWGRLSLADLPRHDPLDRLRLRGFGDENDGVYRVARVRLAFGPGWRSGDVLWVERDQDLNDLDAGDGAGRAAEPAAARWEGPR